MGVRAVIVAAGSPDRRVIAAARCARDIPADELRAVHVATDPAKVESLGLWWMAVQPQGFILDVVENRGGVAATIAGQARAQLSMGFDEVVVFAGHLSMRGLGRRLLHDHTAVAICDAVQRVPGAICVLVPVVVGR